MRTLLSIALFLATSLSMTACIDFPARPILSTTPDMGAVDSGTPDQTVIDQDDVRVDARDAAADLSTADGVGSACDPECARPELCLEDVGVCAKCMVDNDCDEGDTLLCRRDEFDPGNNQCVACLSNENCTDPTQSQCDEDEGSCVGCQSNPDCQGVQAEAEEIDLKYCVAGTCYQCTPETETTECDGDSCDVSTLRCTDTELGTTKICRRCRASSECEVNHECAPMFFNGEPRRDEMDQIDFGYCLKLHASGCMQPYTATPIDRHNLETTTVKKFCGVNENLTTCEGVVDYFTSCMDDNACGASGVADAICTSINGLSALCSYPCSGQSECDANTACASRNGRSRQYCGQE